MKLQVGGLWANVMVYISLDKVCKYCGCPNAKSKYLNTYRLSLYDAVAKTLQKVRIKCLVGLGGKYWC